MSRLIGGWFALFTLAGCGGPEAGKESQDARGGAPRPAQGIFDADFQKQLDESYGPKQVYQLDELKFAEAAHEELLRRFDAAARQVAGVDWVHEKHNGRCMSQSIAAMWSNVAGAKRPGSEQHGIKIDVQRDPVAPNLNLAVGVVASWAPAGEGWGAGVTYYAPHDRVWSKGTRFRINFRYYPGGAMDLKAPALEVFNGLEAIQLTKRFDDTEYGVSVAKRPPTSETISDDEVLGWLESADALRNQALARLDKLAEQAEEQILSGAAIYSAHFAQRDAPRRRSVTVVALIAREEPQAIPPPESRRAMTEEERRQVLADALADIEERRTLIRENYAEMFAALQKVFPLREQLLSRREVR